MGNGRAIDGSILESLRGRIAGDLITPGDAGYDEARAIWNGRFDRHPAAIAYCTSTDDVIAAVNTARENDLLVSVRSGGHDYAGKSVADDALVIDLSRMDGVDIDAASRTVRVGPGVKWGVLDAATQPHGLAAAGGTVSTVGIAGFTLGGGTGWLTRKHGLALDNLLAAEVVVASGELVRASETENEDLFWALRGGSGNFGIVVSFEIRLHPVGPQVVAGQILHPIEAAPEALRFYRSLMADAPDELQCFAFFLRVPPLEFFPAEYHGQVALDLVVAYSGDPSAADEVLEPLRKFGEPFFNAVGPQDYVTLQQSFDAGMPPGNRWYSKAHELRELSDAGIETIIENVSEMPGAFTLVYLGRGGGAVERVNPAATAYPHRDAAYGIHIFPGWQDPNDDDRMAEWARAFHRALEADSTGGIYVNLLDGDEADPRRAAWGANYERLAEIKRRYDPENLFRSNQNIEPAG